MINNKSEFYKNKQKGIALFIAILVSGVVLVIGASVMDISLKEMKLSSIGRESAEAFYAADTGLECALYWDDILKKGSGTIFPKDNSGTPDPTSGFSCAGGVSNISVSSNANSATTDFTVKFGVINEPCSNVSVYKITNSNGRVETTINSTGLNSCNNSNTRRSERGVKIAY